MRALLTTTTTSVMVCVSLSLLWRNVVYFEKDTKAQKRSILSAAAVRYYEGGVLGFTNTSTMKVF